MDGWAGGLIFWDRGFWGLGSFIYLALAIGDIKLLPGLRLDKVLRFTSSVWIMFAQFSDWHKKNNSANTFFFLFFSPSWREWFWNIHTWEPELLEGSSNGGPSCFLIKKKSRGMALICLFMAIAVATSEFNLFWAVLVKQSLISSFSRCFFCTHLLCPWFEDPVHRGGSGFGASLL